MKTMDPFAIDIDLEAGIMADPKNHIIRRASDMRGYYADQQALESLIADHHDPLHYEVFEVPVPHQPGHLMYCISVLQPGSVAHECYMTKGHFHTIAATAEIYLCLRGQGCVLMKTEQGKCLTLKMSRGRMIYIPPFWAHRSVNTSDQPLVSFCVYPADAGHNYGDFAQQGFPIRIFRTHGKVHLRQP